MSFSICLIGNSHVAAIKQAWTNRAPALLSDVTLDFFSAGTNLLPSFELDGKIWRCGNEMLREKIAYTSGGQDCIDLSRYDAFVVLGTGFGLDVPKFSQDYDIASESRAPEGKLLSGPCFAAMIEAWFEDSLAVQMIGTIKSVSDKPALLCAAPHLSERVLTDEEPDRSQERFKDTVFLRFVANAAKAAGKKISARHGFELVWQDDETVGVPGFTKAVYGLNPIRFTMMGGKLPAVDRKHGNEDYGLIMLNAILRRLDEISGGKVLPAQSKTRAAE
jgi:hypothetical protein